MKIFFFSQHPKFASGMSRVGDEVAKRLSIYYDVTYFGHSTEGGKAEEYHGYELVGNPMNDSSGQQMFGYHYMQDDYDLVFTNLNWQSVQWLHNPLNQTYMNSGKQTEVILYCPFETEDKPPMLEQKLLNQHLNDIHLVPFNEPSYKRMKNDWGLENYLFNPDGFVPHGVNRSIYKPVAKRGTEPMAKQMGIENDFVVMFCGENWRRKNIDILIQAYKEFQRDKDDTSLMLHTSPAPSRGNDPFFSGWNIKELLARYGLQLNRDVYVMKNHAAEHVPEPRMAIEYSLADVYVLPTGGEAFSMTSLEAMSCGTPCIHTDLENIRWLCGDASLYVDSIRETAMRTGETLKIPSREDLVEKMQKLYDNPELRNVMGQEGVERAKDFTWDDAGKKLNRLIEEHL